jgi:hypothetical protein
MRSYVLNGGIGAGPRRVCVQTPFGEVCYNLSTHRLSGAPRPRPTSNAWCHGRIGDATTDIYLDTGAGDTGGSDSSGSTDVGGLGGATVGGDAGTTDAGSGNGIQWGHLAEIAWSFLQSMNWGPSYDPTNGGEIRRQLDATSPPWNDASIARYIAWLPNDERKWNRMDGAMDIWENDGASPSNFRDGITQVFGAYDITTNTTQFPFPNGPMSSDAQWIPWLRWQIDHGNELSPGAQQYITALYGSPANFMAHTIPGGGGGGTNPGTGGGNPNPFDPNTHGGGTRPTTVDTGGTQAGMGMLGLLVLLGAGASMFVGKPRNARR